MSTTRAISLPIIWRTSPARTRAPPVTAVGRPCVGREASRSGISSSCGASTARSWRRPSRPGTGACSGIGFGRTMASIVEQHHDERGIRWPVSVAPFAVHLVALNLDRAEVREAADALAAELAEGGLEALYDDREESAGVKFNDADLLGMPVRLTVSPRTLAPGVVGGKPRTENQATLVERGEVVGRVRELLANASPQNR